MKNMISTYSLLALAALGVRVFNDGNTVEDLQQQLIDLNQEADDIQNRADADGRDLTNDEAERIDAILTEFEKVQDNLTRRETLQNHRVNLNTRMGRQTAPNAAAEPGTTEPRAPRVFREPSNPIDKNQWGFRSFGEYAMSVRRSSAKNAEPDPRLIKNAPTSFGSEGVGADGGFLIPPEFRRELKELIFTDDSLVGMCDQMTTTSNSMTLPVDENAAWDSTDGVQCYWEGEANQFTQSKPNIGARNYRLNKLTALVPVTEEMIEDGSAIDSYLRRKVPEKMDSKINTALIDGTGAGVPLGILNAPATISVAKESGQAADTIVFENIVNMWARMPHGNRRNAVWLINQDIEPQLDTMSFEGTSSSVPAYLPANGLSGAPYSTLKGRPVIPIQACKTLGDKGDIILADMAQYMALIKTGGVRTDVSMHLFFDYDMLAYRFIMRMTGKPWLSAAITPQNGSNTLSPFVTLAARA